MPSPTFQLRKVKTVDNTLGAFLDDYNEIKYSDFWNDFPTMTLKYPTEGANRKTDLPVVNFNEVALQMNESEIPNGRIFLDEIQYDPVADEERIYSGSGVLQLLEWTKLWITTASSVTYTAQKPGAIASDLKTRSVNLWSSVIAVPHLWYFHEMGNPIATHDSNNIPWSSSITTTLANNYSVLRFLQDAQEQGQLWLSANGRAIILHNQDYGIDWTTGSNQVILYREREIVGATYKKSARNLASASGGKHGTTYTRKWVPSAFSRDNMVREDYLEDSNVSDSATRNSQIDKILDEFADGHPEITLEVSFHNEGSFYPILHFRAGDWIWVDLGGDLGRARYRVMQITVIIGSNGTPSKGTIVCNHWMRPTRSKHAAYLRALRQGRIKLPT